MNTGQCLCGAVKFEVSGAEADIHACHCSMCRRWNGGPALATEVASVRFSGEEHIERFASSSWAERGFCRKCGSNLFYLLKPSRYMMWTGAFDDAEQFRLVGEICVDDKPGTYDFVGEHPRHGGLPGVG